MAEITNDLIYEVLKSMQGRLDRIDHTLVEVKSEIQAVRGHMLAIQQVVANIYSRLGNLEGRVDRIDVRLGLAEATH